MNILLLSVGTRCKLVEYFRCRENGFDSVITTDCSIYAPALYISDKYYIVPRIHEPDYIKIILEICRKDSIDVVIPLQEEELEIMASCKNEFDKNNIMLAVSDVNVINLCKDKYGLYNYLMKNNINVVKTYDYYEVKSFVDELEYPVVVKKRRGAGSVNNLVVNNAELLKAYAESTEEMIVQPYFDAEEYGVDAYVDFISGELISVFAKRKIRMRAGETEKSKSVIDNNIFKLVQDIVNILDVKGAFDIDIFKKDGIYYVLEINPRFGGGYPHAYECGVNFIKYLSFNAYGNVNKRMIGEYLDNMVMLKYTDAMLIDEKDMF